MENKVAVITGAGTGIGKACAFAFSDAGYSVVINGRRKEVLDAVADTLIKRNRPVLVVKGDVSLEQDCRELMLNTTNHFGRIDVLINNAGLSMRALFERTELAVLRKLMDVNFWGTVYCTKYALPHLLDTKGSVVGISSIAGKKGLPGRTGYSASKFAMEGFLESLRTENLKKDLHVLVACPGFTATDIRTTSLTGEGNPQGESPRDEKSMMSAEEVAAHILKAVMKRKRDLVLTSNGKLTVWLDKFLPSLMDKMVFKHMSEEPGSPF